MENDELMHRGTPHDGSIPHSGRYAYGSGENPYQREDTFLTAYRKAKAEGKTDKEFYESRQMKASEFRARLSNERAAEKTWYISRVRAMHREGWSNRAIAKELFGDYSKESTVRGYLKKDAKQAARRNTNVADFLEKEIKNKKYIDVGKEVNRELSANTSLGNVSETRLKAALQQLQDRGYEIIKLKVPQLTNPDGQKTTMVVAAVPGTTAKDLWQDLTKIKTATEHYTIDNGETITTIQRPSNLDSSRIYVRYAEDGGTDRDGTIELRRGVNDLSLGKSLYAQVRIAVDGTHYMKGMAHYSDDVPKGYDVVYNTNKKKGTPVMSDNPDDKQVLKTLKSDPDNPFGALISRQMEYTDKNGEKKLSPINILREDGDWENYSKTLSSQFLSKQSKDLIKTQLNLTYNENKEEFEKLKRLNNPAVKQKLMQTFAEQCDSAAEDLKATALPRQASKVLLPLPSLKENEIYAPTYNDGEHVVLIRYPHAGTFEIPELIVNNKNKDGERNITKNAVDAVGIHPSAAAQLSGADFDGDHVIVIPVNSKTKIDTSKPLAGLKNFDTKEYQWDDKKTTREFNKKTGKYEDVTHYYRDGKEFKPIDERYKQIQMGIVSNLITDMTLQRAPEDEIERAVKHSMVIIDSEKHKLNYQASAKENQISELHKKYQGKAQGGAYTLISKAGKEVDVPAERRSNRPDPDTGKWIYTQTGEHKKGVVGIDETTGKKIYGELPELKTQKKTLMSLTDDAYTLSSGNPKEELYADYANKMKAMANEARKEAYSIKPVPVSATAKQVYSEEVKSLEAKLNVARLNSPKEREAQRIANQVAKAKIAADPSLDKEHKQRVRQQELTKARALVGANKKDVMVTITPKEWEAIQAGAISTNKLKQILDNTDMDKVRQYATPSDKSAISEATIRQIEARLGTGRYTIAEIAESAGVSPATVSKINKELKGGN